MKKLVLLSFAVVAFTFQTTAQNGMPDFPCPPTAYCHPNGSGLGGGSWETANNLMDSMTAAADAVGKDLKQKVIDSGSDKGVWGAISDWIKCSYGKNTPQYSECSESKSNSYQENSLEKYKKIAPKIANKFVKINPNFLPAKIEGIKNIYSLRLKLDKLKRGSVIGKLSKGSTLHLGYKYFTTKSKKDFIAVFYVTNKNKIIGTPVVYTKNNNIYIVDMIDKLGNFEIQD